MSIAAPRHVHSVCSSGLRVHGSGLSCTGRHSRCVEDDFLSIFPLSLILLPTQTSLCGLTPESVQVSCVTLSKESGGWKEAAQHTGSFNRHIWRCTHTHTLTPTHAHTHTGTHTLASCREEDKMSGLVLGDNCWCCCRHGDCCGVGLQQKTAALKFT